VAVGYYLHTGTLTPYIHVLAVPIGLKIFNVILLNEYPDREADRLARKLNILARIGPQAGVYLYSFIAACSWAAFAFSLYRGIDRRAGILYIPVLIASLIVIWNLMKKQWQDDRVLERLCAVNIFINLATTAIYLVTFLWLQTD
jgi:1,4-dihydroxy-2-naphthoate octaprenyltransferase